ncbi:hypothetical protein EV401DRAFT_1281394 [Pisolithus croceorrhizus]|nr:hypothetical protein EV401DRAFT_1281394 [Pisolithus croceorrhizus]
MEKQILLLLCGIDVLTTSQGGELTWQVLRGRKGCVPEPNLMRGSRKNVSDSGFSGCSDQICLHVKTLSLSKVQISEGLSTLFRPHPLWPWYT